MNSVDVRKGVIFKVNLPPVVVEEKHLKYFKNLDTLPEFFILKGILLALMGLTQCQK